jgi:hypothetical protein
MKCPETGASTADEQNIDIPCTASRKITKRGKKKNQTSDFQPYIF